MIKLPPNLLLLHGSLSSLRPPPPPPPPPASLTPTEQSKLATLIPVLFSTSNHLLAVRLISTALLLAPPHTLPLPLIASHLTSLPSVAPTISLLASFPPHHSPLPLSLHLITSSFSTHKLTHAAKVFAFLCKNSPYRPDRDVYDATVKGFSEHGRGLEVLKVVREMVRDGVAVGEEGRRMVWGCLVGDARVDAARELDEALGKEGVKVVVTRLIKEWED